MPSGEISVILPPTATPSRRASRSPMATPSSPKSASEPATIWSAISLRARMSSGRMPRTSAPAAAPAPVAITWPSTSGVALDDARAPCAPSPPSASKSVSVAPVAIDAEMAVEAEDAADQIGAEPVHHRHDDDQRRDAERDAQQREDRDDRDEPFLAPRPQIAERDHPLEGAEDHARYAVQRRVGRQILALAGAPVLHFDRAGGDPARADDQLPGQADQVHRRRIWRRATRRGRRRAPRSRRRAAWRRARRRRRRISHRAARRLISPTRNGATLLRPDDAGIVVAGLDQRADEARHADAVGAHLERHRRCRRPG